MFSKSGVITITMKNSSKVKMLLRSDILNQKSASISGSYSHAEVINRILLLLLRVDLVLWIVAIVLDLRQFAFEGKR